VLHFPGGVAISAHPIYPGFVGAEARQMHHFLCLAFPCLLRFESNMVRAERSFLQRGSSTPTSLATAARTLWLGESKIKMKRQDGGTSGFGEFDPEAAALTGAGFHTSGAAHAFDAFADDGKADAGARVCLAVQPLKDEKDTLDVLRGNADAIVRDPKPNSFTPFLSRESDLRRDAGWDEFQSVAEKVGQDLD
jgi:hypothetical protein